MFRRVFLAVAAVAVIGVMAMPAVAANRTKTAVYFDSYGDEGGGWLESSKQKCIRDRKIVARYSADLSPEGRHDFQRIGKTRSNRAGEFKFTFSKHRDGLFVAKATRTDACKGARDGSIWD